jgi:hypothetical protein
VGTRTTNAKRLKLIAATALGLDALTFFVGALFGVATESIDATILVPFLATAVLASFAWLGVKVSAGLSGGCLLPFAFFGFWFWALGASLSGVSLAWFLFFLVFWSFIPLISGVLFLLARRIERPSQEFSALP